MIVFAGPSLAGQQISGNSRLDIRDPVRQGDVYLATLERPSAIGIIDGYFEGVPSVWHKEILWAMSQGIPVLGAASMGALRASELDTFGMIGIGVVYEAFRDGHLEDDDEVALVHAPEEMGYVALSVAMVNVRATCMAAAGSGLISNSQADFVIERAKAQFYKNRTWDSILRGADPEILPLNSVTNLRHWIDAHEVDQKGVDALLLLKRMAQSDFGTRAAQFHFEQTDLWIQTTDVWRRREREEVVHHEAGYRLLGNMDLLR